MLQAVESMTREHVYTVEEIAELLRTSPRTVRTWIAAGKLRAFKAGQQYRIRQSALDEFMQKGESESIDEDEQK